MCSKFDISPGTVKRKSPQSVAAIEEVEHLILNPFGQIPKVLFENIFVGSTAKRIIILHNPSKKCMEVGFTKLAPDERQLNLNWYKNEIPAEGQLELELTWSPKEVGGWRDTIVLEDTGRIRKNIPITFKSIPLPLKNPINKKKIAPKFVIKKKSPVKVNKISPKKFLSPKNKMSNKTPSRVQDVLHMLPKGTRRTECDRSTFKIDKTPVKTNGEEQFDDSLEICEAKTPVAQINVLRDVTNPTNDFISTVSFQTFTSTVVKNKSNSTFNILNVSPLSSIQGSNENLNINNATYNNGGNSLTTSPVMLSNWKSNDKENMGLHLKIMEETNNFSLNVNDLKRKSNSLMSVSARKKMNIGVDQRLVKSSSCMNDNKSFIKLETKYKSSTITSSTILPFSSTATNPFFNMSVLCDPSWVKVQENNFKKWLNSLLTPPEELVTDTDITVDIGKLWDESSKKTHVPDAPTREIVSIRYHTQAKLDLLRVRAMNLYRSYEISEVLTKVSNIIENEKLEIRNDKNVHMDLPLRRGIMSLFFCYNPLWLRIGLETVYGITIPLKSNSDVYGLANFIILNFFGDHCSQKYKIMFDEKLAKNLKKQMLKTFLTLTYFLDQAKQRKIIQHDPCLFSKNAPFKESRDILIQFSRETLSAVGDITRFLRTIGYTLNYKQTYIEEYNFAVIDLYNDLKNGVVLARVMEIILLIDGITNALRLPAISRLQKIHNVKLSFHALLNNNFTILGSVEPSDIVAGEKDKVLSFLWQIIHQFQVPRLNKSARIIQIWFRSLSMNIKRRILLKRFQRKETAAVFIQKWYRRQVMLCKLEHMLNFYRLYVIQRILEKAAVKIQAYWRMCMEKKKYNAITVSINLIQRNFRRLLVQRSIERKKRAITRIQANVKCFIVRRKYLRLKQAVLTIENYYKSYKLMIKERDAFLALKINVIFIQLRFRSEVEMRRERNRYLAKKSSAVVIQRNFRSWILTKNDRRRYLALKEAAIIIQSRYRAKLAMRNERNVYLLKKRAVKTIETYYSGYKLMIKERQRLLLLKSVIIKLQRMYREKRLIPAERYHYLKLRKATLFIQMKYRAKKEMMKERNNYLKIRYSALSIQRFWKQKLEDRREIKEQHNKAAIKIQSLFKGYLARKRTNLDLEEIRKKLEQVTIEAKLENTLAARCDRAMKLLSNNVNTSIPVIKTAFEELEKITRTWKKGCEIVCEKCSRLIFIIVGVTIKSLPEQDVCAFGIGILINLCKHSRELMSRIWYPDYLITFFDLMIYYSDKDCNVFSLLSTLIWLFAQVDDYNTYISSQSILKTKFEKMYQRCVRKHKMLQQVNKSSKTYFYNYKNLELPNVNSTWGLKNKKPHTFGNSLHAVKSLADILMF